MFFLKRLREEGERKGKVLKDFINNNFFCRDILIFFFILNNIIIEVI